MDVVFTIITNYSCARARLYVYAYKLASEVIRPGHMEETLQIIKINQIILA